MSYSSTAQKKIQVNERHVPPLITFSSSEGNQSKLTTIVSSLLKDHNCSSKNISLFSKCFAVHCLFFFFFAILEAPGGQHAHSCLLHLIHSCLTTARLFPKQKENTRERAQTGQRGLHRWFDFTTIISSRLAEIPWARPPGHKLAFVRTAQIESFPFKI